MAMDKSLKVFVNNLTSDGLIVSVNDDHEITVSSSMLTGSLGLTDRTQLTFLLLKKPEVLIHYESIVSLNLNNCKLSDLPDTCRTMKLVNLNLSHNTFKVIPNCIYGFKFLENLDLSYNKLGLFNKVPACVIRLQVLHLNNNRFLDVPMWIQQMECFNLEELYYSDNNITGFESSKFHVVRSYRLKRLEMRNCFLRSRDLRFLKLIRSLHYLDIGNVSKHFCNVFSSMNEFYAMFLEPRWNYCLRVLNLNNLMIDNLPKDVKCLVNLEELYLSHNHFFNVPECLTHLKKLKILDVSHNKINELDVDVSNWENLECLKASNNYIVQIDNLLSLNLKCLDLYKNCIVCAFEFKSYMKEVDLEKNYIDTAELQIPNYENMKNALRLKYCCQTRLNGPHWPDNESVAGSSESSLSEPEICDNVVDNSFTNDKKENWDVVNNGELLDNGCTLSDNEWKGYEEVPEIPRQNRNHPVVRCPSWIFEDV